jgi:hypothetical protein
LRNRDVHLSRLFQRRDFESRFFLLKFE